MRLLCNRRTEQKHSAEFLTVFQSSNVLHAPHNSRNRIEYNGMKLQGNLLVKLDKNLSIKLKLNLNAQFVLVSY